MGAVAPGIAGTTMRRTEVKRKPFWMHWGNDGEGRVKLLPVGPTHNATLLDADGSTEPYYQSKGMVPLSMLPADHKAHKVFAEMQKTAREEAKAAQLPMPQWAVG